MSSLGNAGFSSYMIYKIIILYFRSNIIPGIVIFLQKMCRGTLARREYKRMVAAR